MGHSSPSLTTELVYYICLYQLGHVFTGTDHQLLSVLRDNSHVSTLSLTDYTATVQPVAYRTLRFLRYVTTYEFLLSLL